MSHQNARPYEVVRVCVDSYDAGVLCGRVFHPDLDEAGYPVKSLAALLVKLNMLFGLEEPEQPLKRTFAPLRKPEEEFRSVAPGRLGTFDIRLMFRENNNWQGSAHLLGEAEEQVFLSDLELVHLLNNGLTVNQEKLL